MMRTQKASWMTTFSGSWRPLAACLPEQVGVHPGRALLTDFLRGKRQDLESICHQARANIHPGIQAWRENLATTTSTNMCITSTTQAVGSPGSRRKRRLRCAYSLAVLPTAWALILWSIQGQLLLPCDCNNIIFFLTILLTAFFFNSIKGKREYRKFESARPYDTTGNGEEVEKNQKILLWLMEGEKEMVQHKKSPYGWAMMIFFLNYILPGILKSHLTQCLNSLNSI